MDIINHPAENKQRKLRVETYYMLSGLYTSENTTAFQSDDYLTNFVWKNEISSPTSRILTETSLIDQNTLIVKNFNSSKEQILKISDAAIPEPFLDLVLVEMLKAKHNKIIVDMLQAQGKIIPVIITLESATEDQYILNLDFIDEQASREKVYLNKKMKIQRAVIYQKNIYYLERTDLITILKLFPERTEYIQQKIKELQPKNIFY